VKDPVTGKRKFTEAKVNVIRYADDFIVTCRDKDMAPAIIEACDQFLKVRGLELNKQKTKITMVDDGFNFLGFSIKN
jgi:RNA-directed DNA polymerase